MENTKLRIKNMTRMFYECIFLKEIKGISDWDTSEVTNMSRMFYKCNSLIYLPKYQNGIL